ncbi:MAG: beta-N-acetylhexosaminidase [Gammaproteobacteria bacterium]|nr:beta-N-acetylhexosaminidase [Gammaproteobacteria bacterium]
MSLGTLMVDIAGTELSAEDHELLQHPLIGGVLLFTRNYTDPEQLSRLVADIHALRTPSLLVAVDQEGGRVQRFQDGFTRLPSARIFGNLYERDASRARRLAENTAWLMAAELRAAGVDMSFAPVLDLDYGRSAVIGDRAFHHTIKAVSELGRAWLLGMRRAGMAATGKHFPGHGAVSGDSHHTLPVDERPLDEIRRRDLKPYEQLIRLELPAVMMAHVVYPAVDALPASLSRRWIEGELRAQLGFTGAVFCDDLSMRATESFGGYPERARAALAAGCDMLPVCNYRAGVMAILGELRESAHPMSQWRLARLHGGEPLAREDLLASREWREARDELERLQAGADFKLET